MAKKIWREIRDAIADAFMEWARVAYRLYEWLWDTGYRIGDYDDPEEWPEEVASAVAELERAGVL